MSVDNQREVAGSTLKPRDPDLAQVGPDLAGSEQHGIVRQRLAIAALNFPIPRRANAPYYFLGALTLSGIILQVATGIFLVQFYNPDPAAAHDSMVYLLTKIWGGSFVRSLHYWGASLVALAALLHICYVFWHGSYHKPREVTWWAGVGLFVILIGFVFTGTVLRWDQEGFDALQHLVELGNRTGPLGVILTPEFTDSTPMLPRIYAAHILLLPAALAAVLGLHLWLVRYLDLSVPYDRGAVSFLTHLRRGATYAVLALAGVGLLAFAWPEGLGYPPVMGEEMTKPFWAFLWIYGLENFNPQFGLVYGPPLLVLFLLLVPFLDRSSNHGVRGRVGILVAGVLGLAALVALSLYAWLAPPQVHF